ncbi:PAF acetylhydrolase family protein [Drechslerella dactyloides]|uniref:1-alkyl-2-acetylglycerophosphocholine esterase n=1 Tax=Drechslerella dactyloides TaxID=74499 RepID=A0AAD6IYV4_DREDA|nr:PAF acetylhydrolase family protein [Drechslerella dactyloides]
MAFNTCSASLKSYLILSLSSISFVASQVLLPYPNGDRILETALAAGQLTDESRIDPWAPTPNSKRKLMVSMFYPIPKGQCEAVVPVPYMPPSTATAFSNYLGIPDGIFQPLNLQVCKPKRDCRVDWDKYPVVMYSPGFSSSRLLSSAQAQMVASAGYVVVLVDHPYDAVSVQFPPSAQCPDGEVVPHSPNTNAPLDATVPQRVADTQFVLNTLSTPAGLRLLVPSVSKGLNVRRAAMFGHSLGGATTFAAMFNEPRIVGGFDLDGTLFGYPTSKKLHRPFAFIGRPDHNSDDDATWRAGWDLVEAWKKELVLANSGHFTFTDGPLLIKSLIEAQILPPSLPPALLEMLGTLEGGYAFKILTTYITTFMDFVVKDKCPAAFLAPEFPEVTIKNPGPQRGPWCRHWKA